MGDDLHRHFPFSAFRTKQNVSKSKLGGEFAKKGWNDFSTGFSENASVQVQQITFTKDESIKKKPKIDPEVFKKQILTRGFKSAKRKPIIEHKEANFFNSKAKDLCSLIQKKALQSENQNDLKTHNFNKCQNSVFLEVQNIQNSFQGTKSTLQPKFSVKSSSEFSHSFITDLPAKKAGGQENVPKKSGVLAHQFIYGENDFSHSIPIKKVPKTNVFSDLYSSVKKNSTGINNLLDPITNPEGIPSYSKENHDKIRNVDDVKFQINTRKVFLPSQNQNNNASFNVTALRGDESSKSKGSSWLQSLQTSDTEAPQEDAVGKKRIRNILPGGFAEQILKLQRIEKSEEVIWDHNVDRSKRKAGKYLPLMLMSVSSSADLVIVKCLSLQTESSESCLEGANHCEQGSLVEQANEVSAQSRGSKSVVVLLKKAVFNKLHLKPQSIFHLYPPWQTLHLPLISCPIILCAKFIDLNSGEDEVQDKISFAHPRLLTVSSSSTSTSNQASNCFSDIFFQWEQPISLSGIIQRIWKVETTNKNIFPSTSVLNHFRYSLLIQEKNGVFYELVLSSTHFENTTWKEFIVQAEGKCYEFQNLHVIHRFCLKKHPQLARLLNSLLRLQDDGESLNQEFYYQLAFPGCLSIPEPVSDEAFPAHCGVSLQPLASLFRETNIERFTCIGKIIFQFKKTLYLCDDSVPKYVQLESLFPGSSNSPPVGSLVLIRDAQFLEGCLFLDNYSSFIQISEDADMDETVKRFCRNRFNQLMEINLQSVIPSINGASENSMFVFITGEVISVDESNALSWLQCNLCFSENLVQDSNLVIYCENCYQVVPKPVLYVKMSVICQCSPHIKAEVELLSSTTKKILQINEDTHQPQCNASDVLGKHIGPLFCCIKSSTTVNSIKQFRALEVDPS